MLNPDMELRLAFALAENGGPDNDRNRQRKMVDDLKQGFRVEQTAPPRNYVYAATRSGEDLFEIQLGIDRLFLLPKAPGLDLRSFIYCEARIKRTGKILPQQGSDTLEVWEMHFTPHAPFRQSFGRQLGDLSKEEFWKRYEASVFDPAATLKLYDSLASKVGSREGNRMSWISGAPPVS